MEAGTAARNSSVAPRGPPPRGAWLWLAVLLMVLSFAGDVLTPLGVADGMLYATVIAAAHGGGRSGWVALTACGSSALILAGVALSPAGDSSGWTVLLNRGMSLGVVWCLAAGSIAWSLRERRRTQVPPDRDHQLHRVKSLHGLLPICAGCKKIRDPEGRWHQLEAYIQSHSEAEFTHGLCDNCFAEYAGMMPEGPAEPAAPTDGGGR
jgi:hypothetical protein